MDRDRGRWVVVGASVALIAGSVLPWVTSGRGAFADSVSGMEIDGILTAAGGVLLLVLGLLRGMGRVVAVPASILILFLSGVDLARLSALVRTADVANPAIGPGLWLVVVAAVLAVIGSVVLAMAPDNTARPLPGEGKGVPPAARELEG